MRMSAIVAGPNIQPKTAPRAESIVYWVVTALFCLQMSFTAYAELRLPQVDDAFTHLGFPGYFRVELSWAKLLGVVLMLAPVPARLKEWAYAGFAIDLASALIAHFAGAMALWRGAGRQPRARCGASRTSSGAACRPRRQPRDVGAGAAFSPRAKVGWFSSTPQRNSGNPRHVQIAGDGLETGV